MRKPPTHDVDAYDATIDGMLDWLGGREADNQLLTLDGYEGALIGLTFRKGMDPVPLYDYERCVQILVDQGATYGEAMEWFWSNTADAWVGEDTPAFAVITRKGWRAREGA